MDIKDLQARRAKLERDIANSVDVLVAACNDDTKIGVRQVSISNMDITNMGDDCAVRLHTCEVDLDI